MLPHTQTPLWWAVGMRAGLGSGNPARTRTWVAVRKLFRRQGTAELLRSTRVSSCVPPGMHCQAPAQAVFAQDKTSMLQRCVRRAVLVKTVTWIAHTTLTMSRVVCLHLPGTGSWGADRRVAVSDYAQRSFARIRYAGSSNKLAAFPACMPHRHHLMPGRRRLESRNSKSEVSHRRDNFPSVLMRFER